MPASTPKWDSDHFLMWRTKSKKWTTDISQITSILGGVFKEQSSSAFAIFKFMQSLSAAIAFFYSPYLRWTNDLVLEPFLNLRLLPDHTCGENVANHFVISLFPVYNGNFWLQWPLTSLAQLLSARFRIILTDIESANSAVKKKHILHWTVTNCWMVLSLFSRYITNQLTRQD